MKIIKTNFSPRMENNKLKNIDINILNTLSISSKYLGAALHTPKILIK